MDIIDDDIYDDGRESHAELLAAGEYKSDTQLIMKGFRLWQKKYSSRRIALQMIIVFIAFGIQIINILTAGESTDTSMSYFLAVVCIILGVYIIQRPKKTIKNLEKSISELNNSVYKAEIYTDKIIITTLYDEYINEEGSSKKGKDENTDSEINNENGENSDENDEEIPATIIHIDNNAVEIVDSSDFYLLYVKKVNIFIIPKNSFRAYELDLIRNKLSAIMGARYRSE